MTPFVPPAREVRKLQYWWLGFAILLAAGGLTVLLQNGYRTGSLEGAFHGRRAFLHQVEHQLGIFLLLLVVSYTARKAVWWVAVGIIACKAISLVSYYLTTNWQESSIGYYEVLTYSCTLLHLGPVPSIIFIEPINLVTMLGLYAYWLVLCRRILSATE
jgi:hypothetical protein